MTLHKWLQIWELIYLNLTIRQNGTQCVEVTSDYLLIKLVLILRKGESFFEVIKIRYPMATNIILVIDLIVPYIESVQK